MKNATTLYDQIVKPYLQKLVLESFYWMNIHYLTRITLIVRELIQIYFRQYICYVLCSQITHN